MTIPILLIEVPIIFLRDGESVRYLLQFRLGNALLRLSLRIRRLLFHVRNRTYHAILGVWLQLDPLCHVASDGQSSLSGYMLLPSTTSGAVTHIQFSTSELHYMREGLHNDIHFNCYFNSRMSPISRVDPMGLACVSYSGPHTGLMDTQYCGWLSRLMGSCCTKAAASNAEQCCAKKGKRVGTCYCSSPLGISAYTCVEVDWECFCPNKLAI